MDSVAYISDDAFDTNKVRVKGRTLPEGLSSDSIVKHASNIIVNGIASIYLAASPAYADETHLNTTPDFVEPYILDGVAHTSANVEFVDHEEILNFVGTNPSLANFLKSLPRLVREHFGESTAYVRVLQDHEENWQTLLIEVSSDKDLDELLDNEEWFINHILNSKEYKGVLDAVTIRAA